MAERDVRCEIIDLSDFFFPFSIDWALRNPGLELITNIPPTVLNVIINTPPTVEY